MDSILYGTFSDDADLAIRQMQDRISTAKLCNTLFNLPQVLLELEKTFEAQKAQKEKFLKSQEGGKI